MPESGAPIRVLHVDDDGDFADLAAQFLERTEADLRVETETDPRRALAMVVDDESTTFDCVVSDLEMPEMDGLALLESIRSSRPDLPFVLFTGKGSEEVASEAIASGVTDYLQKSGGTDQYTILAHRIENAVAGYRARKQHERVERRFRKLIEESVDVVAVLDVSGTFQYVSPAAEPIVGYDPGDLVGTDAFEYLHPDDRERAAARFDSIVGEGNERATLRCRFRAGDDTWVDLDLRGRDLLDDPDVEGVVVYAQDAAERLQRERELERYETMVNGSGDVIYTMDASGRLTTVNDASVSVLGYERSALVGEHISRFVTEDSFERGRQAVLDHRDRGDDGGITLEQEYVTADGDVVPGETHLSLVTDPDGSFRGVVAVVREISARKERDRTFRELHRATRDLVAAESRGEVVDILVGTAREVIGLPLVGLWLYDEERHELLPEVYPDDPALPDEPPIYGEGDGLSWEAFAEGESRGYEDLAAESDRFNPETAIGSELVVPVGDHGVLNSGATERGAFDETDRYLADILAKTAAAALDRLERERTLERLHSATHDLVEAGDREAVAERTLETVRDILGHEYAVVRLLDETGETLRPVATTGRVQDAVGERPSYRFGEGTAGSALALGETVVYDTRELDDDVERGDHATLLCVPLGDYGVMTIAHAEPDRFDEPDVQLVRMLAATVATALDRLDREAELARQNERLAEFASVASHDLRNPLNVALTQAELLRGGVENGADGDSEHVDVEGLDRLERSLGRMDDIISDVLALARGGRAVVEPEPVSAVRVATEAWSTVETGGATLDVDEDLGQVVADRSRLRQVFENLLRNAVEHGSTGDRPSSGDAVENGGDEVTVGVGALEDGFYVEDDGAGVPAEAREQVFESGFTTGRDGTGFGLTIVERIADAHGWELAMTESDGGGARIEIRGVERP